MDVAGACYCAQLSCACKDIDKPSAVLSIISSQSMCVVYMQCGNCIFVFCTTCNNIQYMYMYILDMRQMFVEYIVTITSSW